MAKPPSMASFPLFPTLPGELRLMIWEFVPQPTRLIGQTPCSRCSDIKDALTRDARRQQCVDTRHPDWRVRYIVQPRHHAIFPPLHACQESRRIWLPRYFQPPRYLSLRDHGYEPDDESRLSSYNLRFDVPFISYEADIFAIFQAWEQDDVDIGDPVRTGVETFNKFFDPFLGLDRSRIQHVALGEGAEFLLEAVVKLDLNSLPRLRQLSVLCFGPDPWPPHPLIPFKLHMSPSAVQHLDCGFRPIPDRVVAANPLFNAARLRHPRFSPRPHLTPLPCFLQVLKAWLWHARHTNLRAVQQEERVALFVFEDYVVVGGGDAVVCPLRHVPGCGLAGHTHGEMASWVPPFRVDCMMLLDKTWAESSEGRFILSGLGLELELSAG